MVTLFPHNRKSKNIQLENLVFPKWLYFVDEGILLLKCIFEKYH
jgi:hypothetical protein